MLSDASIISGHVCMEPGSVATEGSSTISTAGATKHCVSSPSHSPSEPNGSNGKWEGLVTQHIVVPAVLNTQLPVAMILVGPGQKQLLCFYV